MTRFVIGNVGVFPFSGSAAVTGNLQVSGAGNHPGAILEVMGPATGPGLRVTGNAEITGDLTVKGTTITVDSATNLKVEGELSSSGPLVVTGQSQLKGALLVSGAATFTGGTITTGIISSSAPIQTSNHMRVGENLHVSGATNLVSTNIVGILSSSAPIQTSDELRVGENLFVSGTATIASIASPTFAGDANFTNDVSISGSLFISSSVESGSAYPLFRIDHHNATSGEPIFFVTGSGIVAIGTDTPRSDSNDTNRLHIMAEGGADQGQNPAVNSALVLENNDHVGLNLITPANKSGMIIFGDANSSNRSYFRYDHNVDRFFFDGTFSEEVMTIARAGDSVNIGEYNSGHMLTSKASLHISSSGVGIDTGGAVLLRVDHAQAPTGSILFVTGSGRVGIGTDVPAAKLSIVGDLSASTNIQAAGQVRVGETLHVSGTANLITTTVTGILSSSAPIQTSNQMRVGETLHVSGATTIAGTLAVADDTDESAKIGRVHLGHDGTNNDMAIFSHRDNANQTDFALRQRANGQTEINAKASQTIDFKINSANQGQFEADGDFNLLIDGAKINFGANSEVTLAHVHNEGLLLTHTATGDNTPVTLTLKSEEDAIIADEVIGAINFKGGDSDGTDTILVAAAIEAVATDTHEADRNATKLAFKTAISEAATEKMTLTSSGSLGIGVTDPDAKLEVLSTSTQAKFSYDADSFATVAVADGGDTTIATSESGDIILDPGGGAIFFERAGNRLRFDLSTGTSFIQNDVDNGNIGFRINTENGSIVEMARFEAAGDGALLMNAAIPIQFRDTATSISSTSANVLNVTAPTLDIDASTAVTIDTDTITVASANSTDPLVVIKNTTNDANGARLQFVKDKGAAGADGDDIGVIEFVGDDAAQTQTTFAKIVAEVSESADTDEAGKLSFFVAESDGTNTALAAGLVLEGEHATDGEVDVTIAAGAASTTTVAGTLTVTSGIDGNNAAITNVGDIDADSVSIADAAVGLNIDFSGANTGLGLITIADNLAAALTVKEGSNEVVKIVSTNSSEEIVLGYKLDLGDNDIENVGTISADVLQPDAAGTGLDIQFEGNTTKNKITLTDNLADALNITEGSNSYLKFTTTNSSEAITAAVAVNGTIFSGSTSILSKKDLKAHDANIEAMLKVSGNVRLGLSSSTAVTVNTDTLDSYKAPQFYILSGTTTVKLPGNHPAGTWFVFKAGNAHFGPTEDIITLSATAGDTIDGNTTHIIQSPFASVNCVSDGANWFIW